MPDLDSNVMKHPSVPGKTIVSGFFKALATNPKLSWEMILKTKLAIFVIAFLATRPSHCAKTWYGRRAFTTVADCVAFRGMGLDIGEERFRWSNGQVGNNLSLEVSRKGSQNVHALVNYRVTATDVHRAEHSDNQAHPTSWKNLWVFLNESPCPSNSSRTLSTTR